MPTSALGRCKVALLILFYLPHVFRKAPACFGIAADCCFTTPDAAVDAVTALFAAAAFAASHSALRWILPDSVLYFRLTHRSSFWSMYRENLIMAVL